MIVPSLLSADFSRLEWSLRAVERAGVDMISLDIMDAHFVPNLTFGPMIVSAVRKLTHLLVETHLMITDPMTYIPQFAEAGADYINVHVETVDDPAAAVDAVLAAGAKPGMAVKPATSLDAVRPVLDRLEILVIMTVEPGFGGQSFMEDMLPKIEEAREIREKIGGSYLILIDGGIGPATAPAAVRSGADLLVAGSAVYGAENVEGAVRSLQEAAAAARRG